MITFPLNDLSWQQFEELVVLICDRILGTGTLNFSSGKDGGRDAVFKGKAQHFPSDSEPWKGTFIIQAKHTSKPEATCAGSDFRGIVEREVNTKLKPLVDKKEVDYYLLFTNRKLSAGPYAQISDFIETNLNIKNHIIGNERIQAWLHQHPDIQRAMNLNNLLMPIDFYEEDLKEIIIHFSRISGELEDVITQSQSEIRWINKEEKNKLNNLGKEYFDYMKRHSLSYFTNIKAFLENPINGKYKKFYHNTISDLDAKITLKRSQYNQFEDLLEDLYNYVFNHSPTLKDRRKLIRIFLHYMYFNCDIGLEKQEIDNVDT